MVNISLGNKQSGAEPADIVINVASSTCTDRQALVTGNGFTHPLLAEMPLDKTADVFHYEYDDNQGLIKSAIRVFATLIHAQNPAECRFKITPSASFLNKQRVKKLYFSTQENKAATETISINQLENIVSTISGITYQYAENTIIDDVFTIVDLPADIDGDVLYDVDKDILNWLENPMDTNRLEIRYIKPGMGFGVYSRDVIKNGDVIAVYSGIKHVKKEMPSTKAYSFEANADVMNMYVDAHLKGNITRFINHAPDSCAGTDGVFEANITSRNYRLNGIEFIIYFSNKDITKGTQLLVDYGASYFKHYPLSLFKTNASAIGLAAFYSLKKTGDMRIMADQGVAEAQRSLLLRILVISGVILAAFEGLLFFLKSV